MPLLRKKVRLEVRNKGFCAKLAHKYISRKQHQGLFQKQQKVHVCLGDNDAISGVTLFRSLGRRHCEENANVQLLNDDGEKVGQKAEGVASVPPHLAHKLLSSAFTMQLYGALILCMTLHAGKNTFL